MERHELELSSVFFRAVFYNNTVKHYLQKSNKPYQFTKDELYKLLVDEIPDKNHQQLVGHLKNFIQLFGDKKLNILDFFDVLFEYSSEMITRVDRSYCFRYKYTDIWRNMTREIDEEIFVIPYILRDDLKRRIEKRNVMDWLFCIEHDNQEIKRMLRRDDGVSENHFHLRGSSAYYYVAWVYLMNNVISCDFEKKLEMIEENHLQRFSNQENEYPLKFLWRKAAAIRLYLFRNIDRILNPCNYSEQKNSRNTENVNCCSMSDIEEKLRLFIDLDYRDYGIPVATLQDEINRLNILGTIDYAHRNKSEDHTKYYNLQGERNLLYCSLKIIREKRKCYELTARLLFLYLIIKHRFRTELVQSNMRVGFYNFAEYQGRKSFFIPWSEQTECSIATDTIFSMIDNTKVYRAELRIMPELTMEEMCNSIKNYDQAITNALNEYYRYKHKNNKEISLCDFSERYCYLKTNDEITKNSFFYTVHFAKTDDKICTGKYRHYKVRNKIKKQADVLMRIRMYDKDTSDRILGIDACASEVDCRPEVFGSVYRYLQDYDTSEMYRDNEPYRQLKATYHAAEDNYDIVDGLRAIYEAIIFLNLRSGSRIGHATLLGFNVERYYEINNPISMPVQNFLDNIVWMYYFIRDNNIVFEESALLFSYLEEKFDLYFHNIYGYDIQSNFVEEKINEGWQKGYTLRSGDVRCVKCESCKFDLYHYYLSYLLRGDDPELYSTGFMCETLSASQEYRICSSHSLMKTARKSFEAVYLNYLYHYKDRVKEYSSKRIQEELPDYFIKAVSLVQYEMKRRVSIEGIAIETNPTSNMFISAIKDYSEHPILSFYNIRPINNDNNIQLQVSINTDDKSVFSTSLSNEYAYLLFYLEKLKDRDGRQMYSRFEILQWLDAVRKMGNEQSFGNCS